MRPVTDAIFERKVTSVPLPLIPFSEWFDKVELSAKNASGENIKRIPAIKLLDFLPSGEMQSEVGGFTPFAIGMAQRVSLTVKELGAP
ncbi:hypothetical protein EDB19DRAFT_1734995, partial [Suillus lakei]